MPPWMNERSTQDYPLFVITDITAEDGSVAIHLSCGHAHILQPVNGKSAEESRDTLLKTIVLGQHKHRCFNKDHDERPAAIEQQST